jgi:hypothetical protein
LGRSNIHRSVGDGIALCLLTRTPSAMVTHSLSTIHNFSLFQQLNVWNLFVGLSFKINSITGTENRLFLSHINEFSQMKMKCERLLSTRRLHHLRVSHTCCCCCCCVTSLLPFPTLTIST